MAGTPRVLAKAEERVFSQNGEDGVLDALFEWIGTTNRFFVEFGCEDATQCNAAYLLTQGWSGLFMDGAGISRNPLAVVRKEFVTAENVNALFAKYGVPEAPDLVSIDVDGNDYHIWKALSWRPRVVVIEYNAHVGPDEAVVAPYDPGFVWDGSDYFGASLRALRDLGEARGYHLVHCESAGVNAFFVAKDCLPPGYVPPSLAAVYRPPNYGHRGQRHPRDPLGRRLVPVG
jgi:hypothetical protein